jgi:hypothetical protein
MFTRDYFERVIKEQVQSIGQSVTVTISIPAKTLEAYSVFAAHEDFVIFSVYPPRQRLGWVEGQPLQERWVFDQVAVPYQLINWVELTVAGPQPEDQRPIGFHHTVK